MPQSGVKNRAHEMGLEPPAGEQASVQGCRNAGIAPSRVSDLTWFAWDFPGFDTKSPRQNGIVGRPASKLPPSFTCRVTRPLRDMVPSLQNHYCDDNPNTKVTAGTRRALPRSPTRRRPLLPEVPRIPACPDGTSSVLYGNDGLHARDPMSAGSSLKAGTGSGSALFLGA